jgi:hypothetical protein
MFIQTCHTKQKLFPINAYFLEQEGFFYTNN